ncbi:MAG: Anthranilate phosphoribosyltransferase [Verrucomicrobiales bacterium]|nr:Anthranilate phosphoribosyltransferase [Verrucomicrobiales bacterium]
MSPALLTEHLTSGQPLDEPAVLAMAALLLDPAGDIDQKATLLRALSAKGETREEIAAFVRAFLLHAIRPPLETASLDRPAIDICGTGGDKLNLFNVSTASMFVLAGSGLAVVKHGNRGITSKSGGADVLEALGIRIDLPPATYAECVKRHGAAFMLAPQYHPAFAAVAPVRKLLATQGTRTLFNIIGPLLNPLQPAYQLAGVFDPALPDTYAGILQSLGRTRAWAVHGTTADGRGMDEISTLGPTRIVIAEPAGLRSETLTIPSPPATLEELQGADANHNARLLIGIMDGTDRGPRRHLVLTNAAAALQITGLASSWEEAQLTAAEAIDSGRALTVLRNLQSFS